MKLTERIRRKAVYEWKKRFDPDSLNTAPAVPDLTLPAEWIGTQYGGWSLYLAPLHAGSIVYSVGVGEDASFDLALIERCGAQLYAFDPTPRSIDWVAAQTLPPQFHFYPYGLADFDGSATFYPPENPEHVSHTLLERASTRAGAIQVPMKRLTTICRELGHSRIDVLKLDIEGAEYDVLADVLRSGIPVTQILAEFHHHFESIPYARTAAALRDLRKAGYALYQIAPTGREFSLIRTDALP